LQKTINAFLIWLVEEKGSKPNTITAYGNDLGQFLAWIEAHTTVDTWAGIAEGDIRAYRDHLRRRDYALTTIARKLAAMRSFFHYQLLTGALDDDPTLKVSTGALARPSPEQLPVQAARQLWDSVPGDTPLDLRDRALIALISGAGLRASQVTALDLGDVTLPASRVAGLALPPAAVADLAPYVERGRPALAGQGDQARLQRPLFLNARGGRLSRQGLWTVLKRRGQEAGLGDTVSPRSLREVLKQDMQR
jgi:integrase/recombinase XerD